MKIDNCKTQEFKGRIDYIIKQRNHDGILYTKGGKKINYNFDTKNCTKPITIGRTPIEDCVAYYWIKEDNQIPVHYITATELDLIKDIPVEKKERNIKPQKDARYNFEVGEICHTGRFGTYPVRVIEKKGNTIKVEKVFCMYKPNNKVGCVDHIQLHDGETPNEKGYCYRNQIYIGFGDQEYSLSQRNIDEGDVIIIDWGPLRGAGPTSTFRLAKNGDYKTPGNYGYHLYKGFSDSCYMN